MNISLNKILLGLLSNRLGQSATQLELRPRLKAMKGTLPVLTESEKKSIEHLWCGIGKGHINFDYWRFYKAFIEDTVNPTFVPDNLYWSKIIRALNPVSLTRTFINKSLYPIIFNGLPQPKVIFNVINGVYYDCRMNKIRLKDAIKLLVHSEYDAIVKPTVATSCGKGISKLSSSATEKEITDRLKKYGQNYICQEIVRQSASTARFNESSLNTFRINTVNINGKTTCECLMMRHGLNGNIVDNFAVGGVVCGMTKDGSFNGRNFNLQLEVTSHLPDQTPYNNLIVPEVSNAINLAIDAHQRFMPHIGHAAWDFAINDSGMPVMIEVNLMLPGIIMEQLTSADSIFGERTEEVIQYALHRNRNLAWTEYVGGW